MRLRDLCTKIRLGRVARGGDSAELIADAYHFASELTIKARQIDRRMDALCQEKPKKNG